MRFARKIVLGGSAIEQHGWFATNKDILDVTRRADFARNWRPGTRSAFFAEHVWEHLTPSEAMIASANCFEFLKSGGRLRLAVPDGFHPDPQYRAWVAPAGTGIGSEDHKVLYTYRTFSAILEKAGFEVRLLEYWDEKGEFHFAEWSHEFGLVRRSSRNDSRNQGNPLSYTSLIADAIKPKK